MSADYDNCVGSPGKVVFWDSTFRNGMTILVLCILMVPVASKGQTDSAWIAETTTVIPGPHYDAGWLHRFFFGDHYRELWTNELVVPVLNLRGFADGLVPVCRGGGFQTMSLRFENPSGSQYVFRSVDKDPTAKLPVMLRETFVADVLQDQISSHHPAGALVVAPLLEAAGVLHATPRLVVMPDDGVLGPFRENYAGILGLIEERPADGPDGQPGFGGSREISGTERVWEEIEDSPENRVDASAFLRARLMDMLVGDWDRHYDQWRWARYPASNGFVWRPIPRDRDQAFSRLDGLILDIARLNIPELVNFTDSYGSIFGLTWTGRAIDRRFLAGLSSAEWNVVVQDLQARLTDEVIESAVRRFPREIFESEGPGLIAALKRRRDLLPQAAQSFYRLLAEFVDVHATDEDEYAEIQRIDGERVRVRLYLEGDGGPSDTPHFDRTFVDSETGEIRLYLHGGDDRAVVGGPGNARLLVRVIGGGGDDTFVDSSVTTGIRTRFYDTRGENEFQRGLAASFDRRRFTPPEVNIQVADRPQMACGDSIAQAAPRDLALPFRDWGSFWTALPWTSFQPDLGFFIGGGTQRIGYGFRRAPYKSKQVFKFGFATGPSRFRAEYQGDFRDIISDASAALQFRYSGIDNIRFHGFGNETTLNAPDAFFDVTLQELNVGASVVRYFSPVTHFAIGPRFKYANSVLGSGGIVDVNLPIGSEPLSQLGAAAEFLVDTRDDKAAAQRGAYVSLQAFGFRGLGAPSVEYVGVAGEARTYLTAGQFPLRPTLALRVGAKRLWGTYPYYDAAFLSGGENLRGFAEQRFAGDAVVFGNAELRLFLTRYRFLLPGEFGVFGLADAGRVFLDGESSDSWHAGGGGGIWFAFIERAATVSVALAQSVERRGVYVRLGFAY